MPDVRIEKLIKRFGNVEAIAGVDIHIPEGKIVTLLGPSGCGKTTTLRCLAGFENPDEGKIWDHRPYPQARWNEGPACDRDRRRQYPTCYGTDGHPAGCVPLAPR